MTKIRDRSKWSVQDTNEICRLYKENKLSATKISKIFLTSRGRIERVLRKNNISARKHNALLKCNENYFEKINTPNKAYILGFLYADGCVLDKRKGQKMLVINLQEQDADILRQISKELEFEGKLHFYDGAKISTKNYKWKRNNLYRLSITSNKLCDDLIKLGCYPRKTETCQFPTEEQVPKNLINHFIRGLMDGDGFISVQYKNKTPLFSFGIVGTLNICTKIRETLCDELNLYRDKKLGKTKGIYGISYAGIDNVSKIFNYLYGSDAELYLERKYLKMKDVNLYVKTD